MPGPPMFSWKSVRWVVGAMLTLAVIPAIGEFFVKLAEEYGLYNNPSARLLLVMSTITDSIYYIPVLIALASFTLGFGLDYYFTRKSNQQKVPADVLNAHSVEVPAVKEAILELRFKNYPNMPTQTKNENVFSWFVQRHDIHMTKEDGSTDVAPHTYIVIFFRAEFWPGFTECEIIGQESLITEVKHRDQKGLLISIGGSPENSILLIRSYTA